MSNNRRLEDYLKSKGLGIKQESSPTSDTEDTNDDAYKDVMKQYNAPSTFMAESAKVMAPEKDVFHDYAHKTIADRENSYTKRWREQKLSPEGKGDKPESYAEKLGQIQVERETHEVMFKLEKQKREAETKRKLNEQKKIEFQAQEQPLKKIKSENSDAPKWGKEEDEKNVESVPVLPNKVNLETTGKLYKGLNSFKGIELKWREPREVTMPLEKWRLYVYKGGEQLGFPIKVFAQPAYLFGKEKLVVDILIEHESCSKQHAILCYRNMDGKISPYLMDLASTNGTLLNHKKIDDRRYYQLKEFDVFRFGESTREYMLMHENSGL